MSGYVASARINRVNPRIARGPGHLGREVVAAQSWAGPMSVEELTVIGGGPASGMTAGRRLRCRAAAVRDRWAQLTFYVLDPESWR